MRELKCELFGYCVVECLSPLSTYVAHSFSHRPHNCLLGQIPNTDIYKDVGQFKEVWLSFTTGPAVRHIDRC